jgi:hypothetical protein
MNNIVFNMQCSLQARGSISLQLLPTIRGFDGRGVHADDSTS